MNLNKELKRDDTKLNSLGKYLLSQFTEVEKKRYTKELEWLDCLRRIKGIYPPEILARIPEDCSKVFIKYTKAKERYIRSKINSIVFPEKGKSWSVKPTPIPDVNDDLLMEAQAILASKYQEQLQQGIQPNPTQEEIDRIIMDLARKRCNNLEKRIYDQLVEAKYEDVIKKVIKSGIRYGTGIWKGPMAVRNRLTKIVYENGRLVRKQIENYSPAIKFIPIWNFYPDMSVTEPEDLTFIFELHCLTKRDLLNLSKQKGFFRDVIIDYIKDHPSGDYKVKNWESHLASIEEGSKTMSDDKPMIKAYQVLEYWGYLDGTYLKAAGVDNSDELSDSDVYEARVWLLGDKVIKISMNPLPYASHPYNIFYFEKDETSIFGDGLPKIVDGTQDVINASARMMIDNAAIVAGPQIEVNLDLLDNDQDVTSVYPRKIWYRTGVGIDAQYPAIRSISLDSHLPEYVNILEVFRKLGDEESSLPSVLWTNLQTNETARGVLIRYKTAHITLMDIVKELDSAIERFLRAMAKWNFEFTKDPTIMCDHKIESKGTDTLLEAETKLDAIVSLMQTITEDDEPYINRKELLIERVKALGLDPERVVRTEEEAQAFIAQQQQKLAMMQQLQMNMAQAKAEYEKAKAANMLAKSKKVLTEDDLLKKQFVKELIDEASRKASELLGEGNPEENTAGGSNRPQTGI